MQVYSLPMYKRICWRFVIALLSLHTPHHSPTLPFGKWEPTFVVLVWIFRKCVNVSTVSVTSENNNMIIIAILFCGLWDNTDLAWITRWVYTSACLICLRRFGDLPSIKTDPMLPHPAVKVYLQTDLSWRTYSDFLCMNKAYWITCDGVKVVMCIQCTVYENWATSTSALWCCSYLTMY